MQGHSRRVRWCDAEHLDALGFDEIRHCPGNCDSARRAPAETDTPTIENAKKGGHDVKCVKSHQRSDRTWADGGWVDGAL